MVRTLRSPRQRRLLDILRTARIAKGMTQAELAAQLRRPQSFVGKYETGERRLDVVELIEITEVLECDPCFVVAELAAMPRNEP